MIYRQAANSKVVAPLLELIERRFSLQLPINGSKKHLQEVCDHYQGKRNMLLWQYGEAQALKNDDYAKAVLISETLRMLLREIDPWPRRKKQKRK